MRPEPYRQPVEIVEPRRPPGLRPGREQPRPEAKPEERRPEAPPAAEKELTVLERLARLRAEGKLEPWMQELEAKMRSFPEVFARQSIADFEWYFKQVTPSKAAAFLLPAEGPNKLYTEHYLDQFVKEALELGPERAAEVRKRQLQNMLIDLRNNPALINDPRYSAALRIASLAAGEKRPGMERNSRPVLEEVYNALAGSMEETMRRMERFRDEAVIETGSGQMTAGRARAILQEAIGRARVISGHGTQGGTMANWPANIAAAAEIVGPEANQAVERALADALSSPDNLRRLLDSTDGLMDNILRQQVGERSK